MAMPKGVTIAAGLTGSVLAVAIVAVSAVQLIGPVQEQQPVVVQHPGGSAASEPVSQGSLVESSTMTSTIPWDQFEHRSFVVPASAPWSEFPELGGTTEYGELGLMLGLCTDNQLTWLKKHGFPTEYQLSIEFINSASTGAASTVKNIRSEGESDPVPAIIVECPEPTGGASPWQVGLLTLGSGEPAVFDEEFIEGGGEEHDDEVYGQAGSPVLFNLAPGESTNLMLRISSTGLFQGRVVGTVTTGGKDSYVLIADGFGVDKAATLEGPDTFTLVVFDGFQCLRGSDYDRFTAPYDPANACQFADVERHIATLG